MGVGGMANASAGGDHRVIVPGFGWMRPHIVGHHLAAAGPHVVIGCRCSLHSGYLLVNGGFPDITIWSLLTGSSLASCLVVLTIRTDPGIPQPQQLERNVDRSYIRRGVYIGFMPCRGVYRSRYWRIT